jgi:hypothetical protein
MENNLQNILRYYSEHGVMTDPGPHRIQFDHLPADIQALCEIIQGVQVHVFWAERYGLKLPDQRKEELGVRSIAKKLGRIQELDARPLSIARPLEKRLVGNCRDFSLILSSILQYQGIPARARCGFGVYFRPDHFEDHWICEYWNQEEERWVMVDAQLDSFQIEKLGIQFDPLDVPDDQFLVGGKAWKMCRDGDEDPEKFGIFDMRGMGFILGDLIRDLLSLNKIEILPWDPWGMMAEIDGQPPKENLELLDQIAVWTMEGNTTFSECRRVYKEEPALHNPPDWFLEEIQ